MTTDPSASKRAVLNTPSLDFLKDLVTDIPDPGENESAAGGGEDGEPAPMKKRAAATKKTESSKNGSSKAKGSSKVKKEDNNGGPSSSKVAIPISSLLGPTADDDDYDPTREDDYDEDEKDADMEEVPAPIAAKSDEVKPAATSESRANIDEDDDYDAE